MAPQIRDTAQVGHHHPARLGAAALLAVVPSALAWLVLLPLVRASWPVVLVPVPRVDEAVLGILACAALTTAVWLSAAAGLAFLALLPGAIGRGATRCVAQLTPALLRRGLSLLLGTGLGTVSLPIGAAAGAPVTTTSGAVEAGEGDAAQALEAAASLRVPDPAFSPTTIPDSAAGGHSTGQAGAVVGDTPSPRFLVTPDGRRPGAAASGPPGAAAPEARWLPTPPIRAADPGDTALLAPTPRSAFLPEDVVTVRQGDSLWSLAARHLGPEASERDIARAWPRWYALNTDVIGDDPDLIRPGQQLRIPTAGDPR